MDERLLWVWLTIKFPVASKRVTELLKYYGSVKEIYEAQSYSNLNFLLSSEIKLLSDKSLDDAYTVCAKVKRAGARIIVYDDIKYPDALRHIDDPPYVLYVKGKIPVWDKYLLIGVVGTRTATQYGYNATRKLSSELADEGAVIVTGLARGLDTIATEEAIVKKVFTVGVIGCGIDVVYPRENAQLYRQVAENGVIITECPPGSAPEGWHFPLRNRIIAGISRGVLVTEAPSSSGALITAKWAMENGRDVFAVPGSIFERNQLGTNRLIQSGAKCVWCARDILEEYPYERAILKAPVLEVFTDKEDEIEIDEKRIIDIEKKAEKKQKKERRKNKKAKHKKEEIKKEEKTFVMPENIGVTERILLEALTDGEKHIDELARCSGLAVSEIRTKLIMLEMQGMVKPTQSNNYKLK